MKQLIYQLSIYNKTRSEKLAILPSKLLKQAYMTEELNGDYSVTFSIDPMWKNIEYLITRNTLLVEDVNLVDAEKHHRWFAIVSIEKKRDDSGKILSYEVFCESVLLDLINSVNPTETRYANKSPLFLLEKIAENSGLIPYDSASSSVENTLIKEFVVGGKNRFDDLKTLIDQVPNGYYSLDAQDNLSIETLPNPSTDLPLLQFRHRSKNLKDLMVQEDSRRTASRIFGFGAGEPKLNMKKTWHIIESDGNIDITHNFVTAYRIALSADSFNGTSSHDYYIAYRSAPTTYYLISDFIPQETGFGTPDKIIFEFSVYPWPSTDERFQDIYNQFAIFVDKADGNGIVPVDYIEDRESYEINGWLDAVSENSDLEFTENLVADPFLYRRAYVSGKHPNVISNNNITSGTNPVFTKETNLQYLKNGTAGQRVKTSKCGEGCHITADATMKSNESIYFSARVLIYLIKGRVRCDVVENGFKDDNRRVNVMPPYDAGEAQIISREGAFSEFVAEGIINESTDHSDQQGYISIHMYQADSSEEGAEWIIDSVMIEPRQSKTESWIEHSTKKILWDNAYNELSKIRKVYKTYQANVRDLSVVNDKYPLFNVGNLVEIIDKELNLSAKVIVKKKTTNLIHPEDIECDFDNIYQDTFDRIAESFVVLEKRASQIKNVVNAQIREKTLRTGPMKTASIVNSDDSLVPRQSNMNIHGDGESFLPRIVFAGKVANAIVFMDKLTVKPGRKVLIFFSPIASSIEDSIGQLDLEEEQYMLKQLPVSGEEYRQDVQNEYINTDNDLLITNNVFKHGIPVKWKKFAVMSDYTFSDEEYNTGVGCPDSFNDDYTYYIPGGACYTPSRIFASDNLFSFFIPPGNYRQLRMIAYGEGGQVGYPIFSGADFSSWGTHNGGSIGYVGNLLLVDVPLQKSYIRNTSTIGSDTFWSTVDGLSENEPITTIGIYKIGSGDTEEVVTLKEIQASNGFVRINDAESLLFEHYVGEPIEEYKDKPQDGEVVQPSVARILFEIQDATITVT